jgi:hypothetical protein
LASALDLEAGETVTWKVVDRTHLLLVRLPERKPLQRVARRRGRRRRGGARSHDHDGHTLSARQAVCC